MTGYKRLLIETTEDASPKRMMALYTAREYVFEDDNKGCQITNSLDCSLTKYYYKDGELYKREDYLRIESPKDGKVIGHNLIYTDLAPKQNPYIFYLPKYLR